MSYLLDTNIVSETRRRLPNHGVHEWISAVPAEQLHVSVLTIGEIGRGVTRLRERGDGQQAGVFERWLDELVEGFGERILTIDLAVAQRWAAQSASQPLPTSDALIAATAATHNLTLVTRNVKDFDRAGIQMINPFGPSGTSS